MSYFQHGAIYWSGRTEAVITRGAIAEASVLGLPLTDEYSTGTGRASDFEGGRLTWDMRTGAVTLQLK